MHAYSRTYGRELEDVTGYQVETGEDSISLQDCMAQLKKSYRFGPESGIARLSQAVNEGDSDAVLDLLQDKAAKGDIVWRKIPEPEKLWQAFQEQVLGRFREYLQAGDAREILQCFERFRILCGLREGPYGVAAINPLIEKLLGQAGLIQSREKWYKGKPLLIMRNDYDLELFNGDSGVVWPDPEAGHELRVYFPGAEGVLKKFHPLRIPEHETLYAMTVHKSQGSEFDEVLLVLPDRDAPVLTRELIYTALTRARKKVTIWGREEILRTAISRRTERMSGLRDELWGKH
jgi:exodeoxyribonuclease V alpha subunit